MNATEAPKLSPFHPLIVAIEIFMATIIMSGLTTTILSHGMFRLFGGSLFVFGGFLAAFGYNSLSPSKPRQAGMVTFLDTAITIGGQPVVVGGVVFVVPYLMGIITIDMDNQEHKIPIEVITGGAGKAKVPIKGDIRLILRPDEDDLLDYNQAGNSFAKIAEQLDGPVIEETKDIVKGMDDLEVSQAGNLISQKLEEKISNDLFKQKKLGLKLLIVRSDFPRPDEIKKKMRAVREEEYERLAETKDSGTITKIARQMQREDAIQYLPAFDGKGVEDLTDAEIKVVDNEISKAGGLLEQKKVFPFEHYREKAERRRLIRDGKVQVVEGVQGSFALSTVPPK